MKPKEHYIKKEGGDQRTKKGGRKFCNSEESRIKKKYKKLK